MRILAVSDMHGNMSDLFVYIEAVKPDLLLCCGDWGEAGKLCRGDLQNVLEQVHALTVYGNHDDIDLLMESRNTDGSPILLEPGAVVEWGWLRVTGINGIWAKSHRKPYYVTDEDVAQYASSVLGCHIDILVTHGCASGLADTIPGGRHGGQRCFLDAFRAVQPRLYICGHLHAPQKRELKDGKVVVNVGHTSEGDYWIFDMDESSLEAEHRRGAG